MNDDDPILLAIDNLNQISRQVRILAGIIEDCRAVGLEKLASRIEASGYIIRDATGEARRNIVKKK